MADKQSVTFSLLAYLRFCVVNHNMAFYIISANYNGWHSGGEYGKINARNEAK